MSLGIFRAQPITAEEDDLEKIIAPIEPIAKMTTTIVPLPAQLATPQDDFARIDSAGAENADTTAPSVPSSQHGSASVEHKPGFLSGIRHILTESYINILLIAVPAALATPAIKEHSEIAAFCICLVAIIPLAKVLGTATEELALYTSETVGGLLNATFGNAVELIIGIVAVKDGLITVTQ